MTENPKPRRRKRVIAAGAATLASIMPSPAKEPVQAVEKAAVDLAGEGFELASGLTSDLKKIVDGRPDRAEASEQPVQETNKPALKPEAKAAPVHKVERPSLDSPWLTRLSQRQSEMIESYDYLDSDQKQFLIMAIFEVRRLLAEGRNINPGTTIAQAALETHWGKDAPGLNYFGIKVGTSTSGWEGDQQLYPNAAELNTKTGKLETVPGIFRKYDSTQGSFNDYAKLIETHYPDSAENWQDVDKTIDGLGAYATDPEYQNTLKKMVHESHLEYLGEIPVDEEFTP